MEIRAAAASDAPALAALHMRNLPPGESEFTQLGARVVRRFYANAIARGVGTVFCAVEDGALGGSVLITANVREMFGRALLAGPRDVAVFLASAEPRGLIGALRDKLSSRSIVMPAVPELVYLMVDPALRGRGAGTLLTARADAWFAAQGLPFYELNVHADNVPALKIYFAHGMRIVREYVKDGVPTYTLRKEFVPA
jgi:ribosomal protein S18 acetylase RimI-like enzyme